MIILSLIALLIVFPLWTWIHETSHLYMVKKTVGLVWSKIYLYPHKHNGIFYWARCQYLPKANPNKEQVAKISLAPRVPGGIAALLAPVAMLIGLYPLAILLYGGTIDTINGSMGISPTSDLQKASRGLEINPWQIRIPGFIVAAISIVLGILTLLV